MGVKALHRKVFSVRLKTGLILLVSCYLATSQRQKRHPRLCLGAHRNENLGVADYHRSEQARVQALLGALTEEWVSSNELAGNDAKTEASQWGLYFFERLCPEADWQVSFLPSCPKPLPYRSWRWQP
ncbi:hypothetical protein H6F86_12110 [Phormidium sp. FACHB-592]|uniref:Uncharacterized protein n=1 Tax=Stenomitos frigidus AS-A4 TaxID=2933935 RepID=A0ABV0KS16_9CYAN|nr:hypothetical protein [Phormidium sp. FACHB-592]MBD2074618.1 hypothetical protein [Phormidium sp. FACHB-592]